MATPLERAIEAFQEGNHQRVILELNQLVVDEPKNWPARFYLAMSYISTGKAKEGLRHFYEIYLKCPEETLRQKAKTLLPVGEVARADAERARCPDYQW